MHYVSLIYQRDGSYSLPHPWLQRVRPYGGVLEALALHSKVTHVAQINYEGELIENGVNYHFVSCSDEQELFPYKLHRFIKSLKPDVVLVHSFNHPLQVVQLRLVLPNQVKIIVQNHAEKPAVGMRKVLQRLADKWVDAYLFASTTMGLDWVAKGNIASPKKIHEVMELSSVFYQTDKQIARAKTGVDADMVYLWVGRLDANKDPLTVVKAFIKFAEVNTKACLYMLYHTEELLTEIKKLLRESPNPDAVKLIGKLPHDDMQYWFNSADFFVAASYYEGSGTALCEALSCGCVPIVSDIPSFIMITDSGKIGLLFSPGKEDELLLCLNKSQELDLNAQRENALAYFKSNLSFEAIAQKIHAVASSL
ncbi:glycosyltransferase family 4 protein [Mucilaginibacter ximonensis]|uniref:Glycosyltransferase family 4 protein n=1 Tax=Mucilaginibacter ximonensis TaxID=538021 RepID=A0ABW5YCY4_9SPHI